MGFHYLETIVLVPTHQPGIQQAIDFVEGGDVVLVAPGSYVENIDYSGKAITIRSDVDGDPATQDLSPETTIIDGNQSDSVVVFQSGEGADSVLKGFTITNGLADFGGGIYCIQSSPTIQNSVITGNTATNYGGGMQTYDNSSPEVKDCVFSDNDGTNYGGGMHNYISSPTVTHCTFTGNTATLQGGGMQNYTSSPMVTNCIFAENSGNRGAGMMNSTSNPTVTNCTFFVNDAVVSGGGMENYSTSSPVVTNCIFWGNTPDEIYDDGTGTLVVTYSCVQGGWPGTGNIDSDPCFLDPADEDLHLVCQSPCMDAGNNSAPGLQALDIDGELRIIDGNGDGTADVDMGCDEFNFVLVPTDQPSIQEAIDLASPGNLILVSPGTYGENIEFLGKKIELRSDMDGNPMTLDISPETTVIDGGAVDTVVKFIDGEGTLSRFIGFTVNNGNATDGGGVLCIHSSPMIVDSNISANVVSNYGGGLFTSNSSPTLVCCTISENQALNGGGMYNHEYSDASLINCTFHGNSADYGGGVFNYTSSPELTNCTFTENEALTWCGGLYNYEYSDPVVINCILWSDTSPEINIDPKCNPTVTFSCVQGGWSGTGNIDSNPCFLDPLNDDFHLTHGSPCIDSGDNSASLLPETDFEGDPRIFPGNGKGVLIGSPSSGAAVDMGADEYYLFRRETFIVK
jgi:hypothetical protein